MFLTPLSLPLWAIIILAIVYGLAGAAIGVMIFRKTHYEELHELAVAYDDLDEEYNSLLDLYRHMADDEEHPSYLYVRKVFDLSDKPDMLDTSFAMRFKRGEDIGKLINLIEENYRSDGVISMRDILDFCYLPSLPDDVFFGWKVSDILEQYRCIQEEDDNPDCYWRLKLPTPHVLDPDLFPYPTEITFYDPEYFWTKYVAKHEKDSTTPPVNLE